MSRYIDADLLLSTLNENKIPYDSDINYFICNAPTADVKEIVHCEYCVHYQPSLFGERKMCLRKDADVVQICYDFSPDDYCSYGERKTE